MAALAGDHACPEGARPRPGRPGAGRRPALALGDPVLAGAYFLVPLYAALRFTGVSTFPRSQPGRVLRRLRALAEAGGVTTVLTLALMVPTSVYVHLRLPRLRRLMEAITILPIVIPPVVLILGVLEVARS